MRDASSGANRAGRRGEGADRSARGADRGEQMRRAESVTPSHLNTPWHLQHPAVREKPLARAFRLTLAGSAVRYRAMGDYFVRFACPVIAV